MKFAHLTSALFVGALIGLFACDRLVELPSTGCDNAAQDGSETDVDCGGSCSTKCADGKKCAAGTDCASAFCPAGICQAPTCSDGVANGGESGLDCGGGACPKCGDGKACRGPGDCQSGACVGGFCAPPSCVDTAKNAAESDVDCGGNCMPGARCDDGKKCNVAGDCKSALCLNGVCQVPSCSDTIKNGAEGDVDCGAVCSVKCDDGKTCNVAADCKSAVCTGSICKPATCSDGVKNGTEGDIDCGVACPAFCADGKTCKQGDCLSGVCTNGICIASGCSDAVKNGNETDKDCGGNTCPGRCDDGLDCAQGTDCKSGVCTGNKCQVPTCTDGVKNGTEPDKDCGIACPSKCIDGKMCVVGGDCASKVCGGNQLCSVPSCPDGAQNGTETDVDCGGSCATDCANTKNCLGDGDCVSAHCASLTCAACTQQSDCGGARDCVGGVCRTPLTSCKTILNASPTTASGTHLIDPDGAGGLAPFLVHCDMTTGGGGWTGLPLKFADANFWDISQSGSNCVTVTKGPADGYVLSNQTTNLGPGGGHSYTNYRFKPPVQVTEVWFKSFRHRTGGSCNTMDLVKGGARAPESWDEAWYVSDGTIPAGQPALVGNLFPDCSEPGYVDSVLYCNNGAADLNSGNALHLFDRTVTLTASAPQFHMVTDEGCYSTVCAGVTGELFEANVPADGDGIWRSGIYVR